MDISSIRKLVSKMFQAKFKTQGDRYDPELSRADIASILRKELKREFPGFTFSVTQGITVTVTGKGLQGNGGGLTALGVELKTQVEAFCNRWNFDNSDPLSDYCHVNFFLSIAIQERLSRADVVAEAERLKRDYWISDMATMRETCWNLDEQAPLTQKAFELLYAEFKPRKPKPELSHVVTVEFMKWVERVKAWVSNPAVQYDRGPKFWKVLLGRKILCFVDGMNGTIYKGSYSHPQKDSPRGTIFDGFNVFDKDRLLQKREYDWMVSFSTRVGKQFSSFNHAWAYAKAQFKLQKALGREGTDEEIEQEAIRMDASFYPVLAACNTASHVA